MVLQAVGQLEEAGAVAALDKDETVLHGGLAKAGLHLLHILKRRKRRVEPLEILSHQPYALSTESRTFRLYLFDHTGMLAL